MTTIRQITRRLRGHLAILLAAGLAAGGAGAAEYRFSPEPIYTPEAARDIYRPLLEYLDGKPARSSSSCHLRTTAPTGATWR